MEKAIKKAIEGGYQNERIEWFDLAKHGGVPTSNQMNMLVLDPIFWQSLGKAEGWTGMKIPLQEYSRTGERMFQDETRYHWHRFIDHLAEGKDAESFFNELLK